MKYQPIDGGGFRIKETNKYYLDLLPMIYNWRLVTTPKKDPLGYNRHWCYAGTGLISFAAAALAAEA